MGEEPRRTQKARQVESRYFLGGFQGEVEEEVGKKKCRQPSQQHVSQVCVHDINGQCAPFPASKEKEMSLAQHAHHLLLLTRQQLPPTPEPLKKESQLPPPSFFFGCFITHREVSQDRLTYFQCFYLSRLFLFVFSCCIYLYHFFFWFLCPSCVAFSDEPIAGQSPSPFNFDYIPCLLSDTKKMGSSFSR